MVQPGITNKTLHCITVKVKIKKSRLFDLRLWAGCLLIKLDAAIAGLSYEESETP